MHHIGLPRSPFQQRQHPLSPPTNNFPFPSPSSQPFSPISFPSTPSRAQTTVPSSVALQNIVKTQDNKDVLLERLHDLIGRLEDQERLLEDETISKIHGEVDKIEGFVTDGMRGEGNGGDDTAVDSVDTLDTLDTADLGSRRMTLEEVKQSEEASYSGDLSPTVLRQVREKVERQRSDKRKRREQSEIDSRSESRSSRWGQESHIHLEDGEDEEEAQERPDRETETTVTPDQASALSRAASEFAERLTSTFAELQARKSESDSIHDLLVQRCEASTERILLLEYRIAEMEDDFSANASELTYLRIQLQAIEALCAPWLEMGKEDDGELSACIERWKIDWEEVNRRSRARRSKEADDSADSLNLRPATLSRELSHEVPLRRTYSHHAESLRVEHA